MPDTSLRVRRRRCPDSVPDLSGEDGSLATVVMKYNSNSDLNYMQLIKYLHFVGKFLISGRVFPRKYNKQNNIEVMHFHEEAAEVGFE